MHEHAGVLAYEMRHAARKRKRPLLKKGVRRLGRGSVGLGPRRCLREPSLARRARAPHKTSNTCVLRGRHPELQVGQSTEEGYLHKTLRPLARRDVCQPDGPASTPYSQTPWSCHSSRAAARSWRHPGIAIADHAYPACCIATAQTASHTLPLALPTATVLAGCSRPCALTRSASPTSLSLSDMASLAPRKLGCNLSCIPLAICRCSRKLSIQVPLKACLLPNRGWHVPSSSGAAREHIEHATQVRVCPTVTNRWSAAARHHRIRAST
jgi:hypothetical protein